MNLENTKRRIIEFERKIHPAWDEMKDFGTRISNLPLYFLEINHHEKDNQTQSVTITHYVPCKKEMVALAKTIQSFDDNFVVCDIGCGNGFLGSLLAREKVNVFGIDNRSYRQPQIYSFYDNQCYNILTSNLSDEDVNFDVAFCSWMTPGLNLTPLIVEKDPKLIIHIFSPDRQPDGSQTTGTLEAYLPPPNYTFLAGWNSFMPKDFFLPLRIKTGLNLAVSQQKIMAVVIYAHRDLKRVETISPSDLSEYYDWDLEKEFINKMRKKMGLKTSVWKWGSGHRNILI